MILSDEPYELKETLAKLEKNIYSLEEEINDYDKGIDSLKKEIENLEYQIGDKKDGIYECEEEIEKHQKEKEEILQRLMEINAIPYVSNDPNQIKLDF